MGKKDRSQQQEKRKSKQFVASAKVKHADAFARMNFLYQYVALRILLSSVN
jgi:hypothetical protein